MEHIKHQRKRKMGGKLLNSYSCSKKRKDHLELVEIERKGVVIDEKYKNIQKACLDHFCPIVIGQKGACYKIMNNIDRGSYGVIYHSREITDPSQAVNDF
jgi:hypothetical protein